MDQVYSVHYFRVTDLWKKLCESHQQLLEITFDEYSLLLGSQIEELEEKVEEKNKLISFIATLDKERKEAIKNLNADLKNYLLIKPLCLFVKFVKMPWVRRVIRHITPRELRPQVRALKRKGTRVCPIY